MVNDSLALAHNAVYRQNKIVEILKLLHAGGSFEDAKQIFDETFASVDVSEITAAERELIASGLNPMEIQNLCNVHAAVFKGKITDERTVTPDEEQPGHPVQVLKLENLIVTSLLKDELLPCLKKWQQDGHDGEYLQRMQRALRDLLTIDKHYARKENLIFPLMDKYGITAPPKVMWGVDDKIRGLIKEANSLVHQEPLPDKYQIEAAVEAAEHEISEMIFKEEQIMLPMISEVFTAADWGLIASESDELGYTLIAQPLPWRPTAEQLAAAPTAPKSKIAQELNQMAQALADQQTPDEQLSQKLRTNKVAEFKAQMPATPVEKATPEVPVHLTSAPAATKEPATEQLDADESVADKPNADKPNVDKSNADQPTANDKAALAALAAAHPNLPPVALSAMLAQKTAKKPTPVEPTRLQLDGQGLAQILFNNGHLDLNQITGIFKVLPIDLTFVDHNDMVAWFSDDGDRVFPRTKAVIGRAVVNCHPPKSVDKVEKILSDFHAGVRDHADFWINFRGKRVYIRYFAVHDEAGHYLGCLEATQNITTIQQLTGEKRLADDE